MDFKHHLTALRMCRVHGITKGALIRLIYELIKDHEGKDFKDIDDLFSKLYPDKAVQQMGAGVKVNRGRSAHQRRRTKELTDLEA